MDKEILEITKKFHDTYEKLASEYTYETREDTKVFDINSSNGKLMYATVNEIVSPILKENQELKKQLEENKDKINWYENFEINKTIDKLRIKHNNQQKEFIEYLEDLIKQNETVVEVSKYGLPKNCSKLLIDFYKEILTKFKEVIGVKDDKK